MSDAFTVLGKELAELLGERHSRRGVLLQTVITIVMLGVFFPSQQPLLWLRSSPAGMILFQFFPAVLAASVAADAFAGERERRTLETLLATPLGEGSILAGKAMASILFALAVTTVGLAVAVVTLNLRLGAGQHYVPRAIFVAGAIGATLAAATVITAAAIIVSMFMPVARSAQQVAALFSMALAGAVLGVWRLLSLPLTWTSVLGAEAGCLLFGLALLGLARVLFRRDRFFDKR